MGKKIFPFLYMWRFKDGFKAYDTFLWTKKYRDSTSTRPYKNTKSLGTSFFLPDSRSSVHNHDVTQNPSTYCRVLSTTEVMECICYVKRAQQITYTVYVQKQVLHAGILRNICQYLQPYTLKKTSTSQNFRLWKCFEALWNLFFLVLYIRLI